MRTGTSIMEFKAYNTDPITLFSVKEFERFAFDQQDCSFSPAGISAIFQGRTFQLYSQDGEVDLDPF